MSIPVAVANPVFPALSVQLTVDSWSALSPVNVLSVQVAIPLVASVPLPVTFTLETCQPLLPSGLGTLAVTAGDVLSILMFTLTGPVVPPSEVAVQDRLVPAVSAVKLVSTQPESMVTPESGSVTDQTTPTFDVYQLLLPRVPVTTGVIVGGVVSVATC